MRRRRRGLKTGSFPPLFQLSALFLPAEGRPPPPPARARAWLGCISSPAWDRDLGLGSLRLGEALERQGAGTGSGFPHPAPRKPHPTKMGTSTTKKRGFGSVFVLFSGRRSQTAQPSLGKTWGRWAGEGGLPPMRPGGQRLIPGAGQLPLSPIPALREETEGGREPQPAPGHSAVTAGPQPSVSKSHGLCVRIRSPDRRCPLFTGGGSRGPGRHWVCPRASRVSRRWFSRPFWLPGDHTRKAGT